MLLHSLKAKLAPRSSGRRAKIILRLPALRESGRVNFPNLGLMSDADFIDLVRRAIQAGYRVYIKDLPFGQAAVPTLKDNGTVSLAVSSEFRDKVERLRRELRRSPMTPNRIKFIPNNSDWLKRLEKS